MECKYSKKQLEEIYNCEIAKDYNCCTQTILYHLRQVKIYKEKGVIQDGQ